MTVREYISVTHGCKEFQFFTGHYNQIESFKVQKEKWGTECISPEIRKYLDNEIFRVFVMSKGVLRIDSRKVIK